MVSDFKIGVIKSVKENNSECYNKGKQESMITKKVLNVLM